MNYAIVICPVCKNRLIKREFLLKCENCHKKYPIVSGIPRLISQSQLSDEVKNSQRAYEIAHKSNWGKIDDGSYEILAAFARGNKTLDVACGEGYIEILAPNTVGLEFSWNAL